MEKNGKKNKNTNERGITLIALIVTIIVLLILVLVTVRVVAHSDLIGVTEKAGDLTKTAYENEANMSKIKINGKEYESFDAYNTM